MQKSLNKFNKILVIVFTLFSLINLSDLLLKTNLYDKYLYFQPIHNPLTWFLFLLLIFQIIWLIMRYFSKNKFFIYLICLNIILFSIQTYFAFKKEF